MNNASEKDDDPVTDSFVRCVTSIYNVAHTSLETKPLWMILNFVHLASNSAISLMPDGLESKKRELFQYCKENMLILTFLAEQEMGIATSLFDELCETGFSSELRAVLCADHYCHWLRSREQSALVAEAIAKSEGILRTHISSESFS